MGRPKKNSVTDAAKLADELIAIEAEKLSRLNESAPDEDPVDNSETPIENTEEDATTYDLSGLDEPEVIPEDKDLAHKLSVLQGKYNKETERQSLLLSQTMTELQTLKAQLAGRSSEPSVAPEDAPDEDTGLVALKEQYPALYQGFLSLAKKEAKSEVGRAVQGTSAKVDNIVKESNDAKMETYYTRLSELVPSWEQINNHPAFVKWLMEPDEFSGTTRRNLLGAAYNRMDSKTSAKFFNAFIKEKGVKLRGITPVEDDEIAPDTASGNTGTRSRMQAGEVTRAEMQKFYQDKAQGKLSHLTETELNKREGRFFQAVREGKVRG